MSPVSEPSNAVSVYSEHDASIDDEIDLYNQLPGVSDGDALALRLALSIHLARINTKLAKLEAQLAKLAST